MSRMHSVRAVVMCVVVAMTFTTAPALSQTPPLGTQGGPYKDPKTPLGAPFDGRDNHHMPAASTWRKDGRWNPDCGPAIAMSPDDHRKTGSNDETDGKPAGIKFRADELAYLARGDIRGAFEFGVQDIIAKQNAGRITTDYTQAIEAARRHLITGGWADCIERKPKLGGGASAAVPTPESATTADKTDAKTGELVTISGRGCRPTRSTTSWWRTPRPWSSSTGSMARTPMLGT